MIGFRAWRAIGMILACISVLTGCWDMKELQYLHNVIGVGIDYEEDQYVVYAQSVDAGSMAKNESGTKPPSQVWVSKGTGPTFNLAANEIYNTSQMKVLWSHVGSILLTEKAIQQGLDDIIDGLSRYREIRETPWIFAAKSPIEDIFTTTTFYNFSPMNNLTHEPREIYEQKSWIEPLRYYKLTAEFMETSNTVLLPVLSINPTQNTKNKKPDPKLEISGALYINHQENPQLFTMEQLRGIRWIQEGTSRTPISIGDPKNPDMILSLERPKVKITPINSNPPFRFTIHVRLFGNIVELRKEMRFEEMVDLVEKTIAKEIKGTFQAGVEKKADLLGLEYALFQKNNKAWKKHVKDQSFQLDESTLESIVVEARIKHTGLRQYRDVKLQ